jgi:PIN domain nuclease of toxin-antitoxin system
MTNIIISLDSLITFWELMIKKNMEYLNLEIKINKTTYWHLNSIKAKINVDSEYYVTYNDCRYLQKIRVV